MFPGSSLYRLAENLDRPYGHTFERLGKSLLTVVLVLGVFTGAYYQFRSAAFRYQLDYGEAVVLDEAMRLADGQSIYRTDLDSPPYAVTVYPPVYMAFLVPFVKLLGPGFAAGRILSIAGAMVTAWFIGLFIFRSTQDRFAAVSGSLIFLVIPYVVFWSTLLRIDCMALAWSVAGLYVLSGRPLSRSRFLLGLALLTLAVYTRQSYLLAAPLAVLAGFFSENRRKAVSFGLVFAASILVVFAALHIGTAGGFYANVVSANVLAFDPHALKTKLLLFFSMTNVLLLCSLAAILVLRDQGRDWITMTAYLAGALISGLAIGRVGAHVNYLLELCAALSLAAGLFLAWVGKRRLRLFRGLLAILLAYHACFLVWLTCDWYLFGRFQSKVSLEPELVLLERMIREQPGPILMDDHAGMLSLQGRFLSAEPFIMNHLSLAGKWDAAPMIADIRSQAFPLIVVSKSGRWPAGALEAVEKHYVQTGYLAGSRIYRPLAVTALPENFGEREKIPDPSDEPSGR